jgi:hypothetical protein
MKYLLLLNRTEDALPEPGTTAAQAMLREYTAAVQAMAEAGVLVDCAPLTATSAATTVRVRDGQVLLTDGPPGPTTAGTWSCSRSRTGPAGTGP